MRQEAIVRLDQGGFTHELIMNSMDKNFSTLITLLLGYMSAAISPASMLSFLHGSTARSAKFKVNVCEPRLWHRSRRASLRKGSR